MSNLLRSLTPSPRDVIARRCGVPPSRLDDACPLAEIAPDSFDRVELLLALEEECGLELSVRGDAARELATLGELLAALRPRRAAP